MAVIGCGNRAGRVFDSFSRAGSADCQFVAAAEVNKAKLDQWMTPARQTFKLETVVDYRRILDRKDVDAVLIATPDFSHSKIMVDAIAAGKDVYVEKPASNTIPRINAMLDAYKKSKQVVQVGTHQRSWDHFIEAKKILDSGMLGTVTQVLIVQPGNVRPAEGSRAAGSGRARLGLWQLDAPKQPFKPTRLGFRAWYAYGSGLVGDWGAHHVDVAHWFMNADAKVPLKTDGERGVPRGAGRRSRDGARLVLDLVALRQLPDDLRQRRGLHAQTASRTGASSSSATAARCRSIGRATPSGRSCRT